MKFNFGAGIAAGAKAAADQYSRSSLEEQKADLENQKIRLADSLASDRELKMEDIKHGHDLERIEKQGEVQLDVAKKGAIAGEQTKLDFMPKIAEATRVATVANMKDPEYVKALKLEADLKETPSQRAAAGLYAQQTTAAKIKNATDQEESDARKALATATDAGDQDAIEKAQTRLYVATYSAKDEVQQAAVQRSIADGKRLLLQSIETRLATMGDPKKLRDPSVKAQYDQLIAERDVASASYKRAEALSDRARENMPSLNLAKGPKPGAPALTDIFGNSATSMSLPSSTPSIYNTPPR